MADEGTLATTSQALLGIGQNGSTEQVLLANTNTWVLSAESEMSKAAKRDLVGNYATIKAYLKPWLAKVAVAGLSIEAINQNPDTWSLDTTQTKLNVHTTTWEKGLRDLDDEDVISRLNL